MLTDLSCTVPEPREGWRLDRFLKEWIRGVPGRSVLFAIGAGDVRVDGERAKKGRTLRAGGRVVVRRIPEALDWMPVPGSLPGASVLFEDEAVAVLDKPADTHTEPHRPMEEGTLAGYLTWLHPAAASISGEPGLTLITRLDYATSGAVPAALTREAYGFLLREREHGRIEKTYVCIVSGVLEREISLSFRLDTEGGETVRARPDIREPDPRYWTVVTPVRTGGGRTIVRAAISKGKRHQIRAHLAAAGFPIVGDRRYSTVPPEGPGHDRLMLHAAQVRFTHPASREPLTVESPLPGGFENP